MKPIHPFPIALGVLAVFAGLVLPSFAMAASPPPWWAYVSMGLITGGGALCILTIWRSER